MWAQFDARSLGIIAAMPVIVSVVIATYNDREVLGDTIRPLLDDPACGEVIVVVDGSRDGSYEFLGQIAKGEQRLRPFFIEHRGRLAARQYGLDRASHEIVLLLDADVVGADGLVTGHARWHDHAQPRLVSGYMPVERSRREASFVAELYAQDYERVCRLYELDPGALFTDLWGGNLSLPRRFIDLVGGFDGGLGLRYHDDLEFGFRLARTGLEPVFDRRLLAEHRFVRSVSGYLRVVRDSSFDVAMLGGLTTRGDEHSRQRSSSARWKEIVRWAVMRRPILNLALRLGVPLISVFARFGLSALERRGVGFLEQLSWEQGVREARDRQMSLRDSPITRSRPGDGAVVRPPADPSPLPGAPVSRGTPSPPHRDPA